MRQQPAFPALLALAPLLGALLWSLVGCTTVKEHTSPVEIRPAANGDFGDWQRTDFHVGGLDTWVAPRATVVLEQIDSAVASTDSFGDHVVLLEFTPAGSESMHSLSIRRMSRPVAVLLDGKIIAAPVLMNPVGDSLVVNFGKTRQGRKDSVRLAAAVNDASPGSNSAD